MRRLPLFLRALLAVLAAFFGVRKSGRAAEDFRALRPLHIIAAGALGVLLFIVILLFAVKFALALAS